MIRPFTLITMLLAAGSGAYLFAVKHHAQMLDDQIAELSQESRRDAQRIRVLQAQWALETDPTRLQQLASQFTDLQPMQPAQLITLTALRSSLPPPGSAQPGANPELPGEVSRQTAPALDASAGQPGSDASGGLPLPPPQAPLASEVMTASAVPAPIVRTAALRPRRIGHSALAAGQWAQSLPPRRYTAPRNDAQAATTPPEYRNFPMGAEIVSVKASAAVPQYTPPPANVDDSGSVLGMAASLPPPLPLPRNGANN